MKKLSLLTLLLAFICMGCNKDDDNSNDITTPAAGTWKLIGSLNPQTSEFEPIIECQNAIITFNENYTGNTVLNSCDTPSITKSFTWAIIANGDYRLTMNGEYSFVRLSFPEGPNKMYFTYVDVDTPTFTQIFEKQEL